MRDANQRQLIIDGVETKIKGSADDVKKQVTSSETVITDLFTAKFDELTSAMKDRTRPQLTQVGLMEELMRYTIPELNAMLRAEDLARKGYKSDKA